MTAVSAKALIWNDYNLLPNDCHRRRIFLVRQASASPFAAFGEDGMADSFASETEIAVPDAEALVNGLADYWRSHDVELEREAGRLSAQLGLGTGIVEALDGRIRVRLETSDRGALEMLRSYVATALPDFVGGDASLDWRGDMEIGRLFADFREVRLVSNIAVAPRIRRLTFTGEDIARFGSANDIHVRMYFPPDGIARPEWPRPGADGRTIWPEEGLRPEVRYYTVRRFEAARSAIEIDFVMHDDEGPGSAFAARAAPGAIVGMAGPVGRVARPADWTLLAGDETALPAIARMLEEMPREAVGAALIEVDAPEDELALSAPRGVSVDWLHRRGAPAGATDLLVSAVRSVAVPSGGESFVWVACEHAAARKIRRHLREERGLPRDRCLVVAYWQRDAAEEIAA